MEVRNVPKPKAGPGWALIRVLAAGICNTDLELRRGYYGFKGIPGHEFVGEVVKGSKAWLGKRVVGEINIGCGHLGYRGPCQACESSPRHCPRRHVLGIVNHPGAFAEYLTLPEANLRAVPEGIPLEHAVFCEPLAAALRITDHSLPVEGVDFAVLGDGKLGLLIAQALVAKKAHVTLFGHHPKRIRLVPGAGWGEEKREFSAVVEATGTAAGLAQAVEMTMPEGVLFLKSTVHDAVGFDTAPIVVKELLIVGSRCGRFEPAIEMLEAKKTRSSLAKMLSDQFDLEDAPRAFERAAERGVLKVLLRPAGL